MIEQAEGVSFTQDQDTILKITPAQVRAEAEVAGHSIEVLQRTKLVFLVCLFTMSKYKAYWIDFEKEPDLYNTLGVAIELHTGINIRKQIMNEGYRWQIRSTHPDFPIRLSEDIWKLYERTYIAFNK